MDLIIGILLTAQTLFGGTTTTTTTTTGSSVIVVTDTLEVN